MSPRAEGLARRGRDGAMGSAKAHKIKLWGARGVLGAICFCYGAAKILSRAETSSVFPRDVYMIVGTLEVMAALAFWGGVWVRAVSAVAVLGFGLSGAWHLFGGEDCGCGGSVALLNRPAIIGMSAGIGGILAIWMLSRNNR